MEYLVDLSFTAEDRMELLRCVCDPGSSFYKVLDTNPPVIVSTFPGPVIYPFFESGNSVDYFYRIRNFYNPFRNLKDQILYRYYSHFPPLFMKDVALWFHNTIVSELESLPEFLDNNPESYSLYYRHFPLPYPKPHCDDVFSITRDILYTKLFTAEEIPSLTTSQKSEEPGQQETQQTPVSSQPVINEDGSQQIKIDEETKQHMDSIFQKINNGEF